MSMTADEQEPTRESQDPSAGEMESIATQLVALVEEFEAALSEGYVSPEFAERLTKLRQAAER